MIPISGPKACNDFKGRKESFVMRDWREIELWKDVSEEQWNDWLWQLTHTIR